MKHRQSETDMFLESIPYIPKPKEPFELFVSDEIYNYAYDLLEVDMLDLYHPNLFVLPLNTEGEEARDKLYDEYGIGRYGAYEYNFKYNGDTYLAIIVNND